MSKRARLLLTVLILGAGASLVAILLTVLSNWFFRGEAGLTGGSILRMAVLGFVIGTTPVGLMWARSRKEGK